MRFNTVIATVLAVAAATSFAGAQQRPPIRQLGAVTGKSAEPLGGNVTAIRQLSNGKVLVNDVANRRVLMFDPTLAIFTVIADSTSATANAYSGRIGGLIGYRGDSTIFVDPGSLSMLIMDGSGKVARVISVPRPQDAVMMAAGGAAFDGAGRLVYRLPPNFGRPNLANIASGGPFTPPDIPDSAAVVRIDLASRKLDTLGFIKTPKLKFDMSRTENGGFRVTTQINPLPVVDDWAVLSDGSVAFVRGRDYHVDFANVDGTRTSAAKLPFDWQRMTDDDKSAFLDSLKAARARQGANAPNIAFGGGALGGGGGAPQMVVIGGPAAPGGDRGAAGGPNVRGGPGGGDAGPNVQLNFVPASELPDYKPPFFANSTRADTEGNLWIRTIPTAKIAGGPVYDVVNRKGELVDRVQVPLDRIILGFGPDGSVYLGARDGTVLRLERAKLR